MATPQAIRVSLRRVNNSIAKPHIRSFTSSQPSRRRGRSGSRSMNSMIDKQIGMQAKKVASGESEIPDDVGLLDSMLIKPSSKDLPSIFSWRRIRIENTAFFQAVIDFLRKFYAKKFVGMMDLETGKKRRLPLHMQDRYALARTLHQQFYSAVAERDESTISEIACTGVRRQMQVRIAKKNIALDPQQRLSIRYKGLTLNRTPWYLQMLIPPQFRSTQILVDRFASLPVGEDSSCRQVIVRIKSTQTLSDEEGLEETFNAEENVVIQQITSNGEEGPWKIWGTVESSTPEQITELMKSSREKGMWSSMKDRLMGAFGSPTGQNPL